MAAPHGTGRTSECRAMPVRPPSAVRVSKPPGRLRCSWAACRCADVVQDPDQSGKESVPGDVRKPYVVVVASSKCGTDKRTLLRSLFANLEDIARPVVYPQIGLSPSRSRGTQPRIEQSARGMIFEMQSADTTLLGT